MTSEAHELLTSALGGREITNPPAKWKKLPDQPWKFWKTQHDNWAVFVGVGNHIAKVTLKSMEESCKFGLNPIIIIPNPSILKVIADYYIDINPHVLYLIAGSPKVILPLTHKDIANNKPIKHKTRVPTKILRELCEKCDLPPALNDKIKKLRKDYQKLRNKNNDTYETKRLQQYVESIFKNMGFLTSRKNIRCVEALRKIEILKLVNGRDHYFHSFQNYFIGLLAISKLHRYFKNSMSITNLNWKVNPYDIWFLTSLYHDIGYLIQKLENINAEITYESQTEHTSGDRIQDFLKQPLTEKALRVISSLMYRLIEPTTGVSSWSISDGRRHPKENKIMKAMIENIHDSHGASSSILLYKDLMPIINKYCRTKVDVLTQNVLLACCSIPFHDWKFREALRKHYGNFQIKINAMPYASSLAFIDSIQDDRRDLEEIRNQIGFLEKLIIKRAVVEAKVNPAALNKKDVLWKIIEATDVNSTLMVTDGLSFLYPSWMVA